MLNLVFLMITCNFATIFIGELREGIGRHWGPAGGMMACSYTFSDMTAFALFIIFLCTITRDLRLNKVSLQSCQYIAQDTHSILHSVFLLTLNCHLIHAFSMLSSILDSTSKTQDLILPSQLRSTLPNLRSRSNVQFSCKCLLILLITVFTLWLTILLLCSSDIHPNSGPSSIASSLNSSTSHNHSNNSLRSLNLSHNLSFVHYNVQSILNKLDILEAELFEFDILAFTETWLNPTVQSDDLVFQTFHKPERKDRRSDHFGGLLLYVKSEIFYKRRSDLEINGIECIWIEVILNKKSLLFGLFYRPPNSSADVYTNTEESISLAVDTGTSDIIITGDFNFILYQLLTDPSHFTEHSSSLLDLILVSNKEHLILHDVGDPFLDQQLRYHCPIYGFCKSSKPQYKAFTRHIWMYNNGNFGLLPEKASSIDWHALENDDISLYASNLNSTILSLTKECIPNKSIKVRTSDPPWIATLLKRQIRKRKRLYRKAKQTNLERHWIKFRQLRNETNTMIRNSKQQFYYNTRLVVNPYNFYIP